MARLSEEDLYLVRARIEKAALRRFTRSGYNGVSMREVAQDAKVPLGSLYNYFSDKQSLFKHLVAEQSRAFLTPANPLIGYLLHGKFPTDLEEMAMAIADSVNLHAEYFKLMYVDVVEFEGRHIRSVFSNLEEKFRESLKSRFREIGDLGSDKSIDPSFAFVTIYLSFYQYFILTKLFGATQVYDRGSESRVVKDLAHLFRRGIGT